MADKVYPASKPAANATTGAAVNGGTNPTFPPTKAQQLYNTTRPVYHPPKRRRRRHRRSCFCSCCLWTTLFIIVLLLLAAIAGAVFWVLYRPHRPNFAVSSLQFSQFKLNSGVLASKFNFALIARNPNKKIKFFYDPINVSIVSDGIEVGDGSFPGFEHGTKNTTTLKTVISSSGQSLDSTQISTLKSELRNKKSLELKIELNTKVKVKVGRKLGLELVVMGLKLLFPPEKLRHLPLHPTLSVRLT